MPSASVSARQHGARAACCRRMCDEDERRVLEPTASTARSLAGRTAAAASAPPRRRLRRCTASNPTARRRESACRRPDPASCARRWRRTGIRAACARTTVCRAREPRTACGPLSPMKTSMENGAARASAEPFACDAAPHTEDSRASVQRRRRGRRSSSTIARFVLLALRAEVRRPVAVRVLLLGRIPCSARRTKSDATRCECTARSDRRTPRPPRELSLHDRALRSPRSSCSSFPSSATASQLQKS